MPALSIEGVGFGLEDKAAAKEQFMRITQEHNLKHTFSFDEGWDLSIRQRYRENVVDFEAKMLEQPEVLTGDAITEVNPLKHSFADGCYIREIFNPAGELLVTKIHKIAHPYFLLSGSMSIMTEAGPKRIQAPHHGITPAGTKRIIYTHEDCIFVTVHVTNETDLIKIEDEVIAKSFDEIDENEIQILKRKLCRG